MFGARTARVAVVCGVVLVWLGTPTRVNSQPGQPDVSGQWSSIINWPLVAVHAALLHTGDVLVWDAWEMPDTPSGRVWNPATQQFTPAPVPNSALFCAAHSMLADGRKLVVGGHHGASIGIADTNAFDPVSGWTQLTSMATPRWYPTTVALGDGRVLVLGGEISPDVWADTPEVYDPNTNLWTTLPGATLNLGNYPRAFLAPDGRVFVVDGRLDSISRYLNVATEVWTPIGTAPVGGTGAFYRPGKIIMTDWSSTTGPTAVIDLNQSSPSWRSTAPMQYGRFQHNLITLPDGKVLAIGGSSEQSLVSTSGVLPAEMWDPNTETWTKMAAMADPRMYHSHALLLPDGRVLAAGGGRLSPAIDHPTAEIYSPPYLFKGPRPTITSAPPTTTWGASMTIGTPDAASIASVALIRLPSVTHAIDFDQRFIPLSFLAGSSQLIVQVPGSPNTAPPGYYMLFIVNTTGVPSTAAMVKIGGAAPAPSILIGDATVTEGNGGSVTAVFNVTLTSVGANTVTVEYATANGSATAGSDYVAASGTVTFPAGSTTQPVTVTVLGDTVDELDETFFVNLSNPTNATIADGQGQGTITDDDGVSIPVTTSFGVANGADDVNQDGPTTLDQGANSVWLGTGGDPAASYTGLRFTGVTIPPGAQISSAHLEVNAASTQWLAINFEYGMEATGDSQPFSSLSLPSQRTLLASRVTHGSDQQWVADTWYPLEELGTLVQQVVNRSDWSAGNALGLILRGTGGAWGRKFAHSYEGASTKAPRLVVTYLTSSPSPTLSISDVTVTEGNSGTVNASFNVTLSSSSAQVVTAQYATANGTATAGSDYVAASGTVTFPAGSTSQSVTVAVNGDTVVEPNETFVVNLSNPTNATIGDGQGLGTIVNDDSAPLPTLSINDVTVTEGNTGSVNASFTVTLSSASASTVTVQYATANGTATAGSDYTTASGTLTFPAGSTSQTITVAVLGDTSSEANETFFVNLSGATNATISDGQGQGTITDNDGLPVITISDVTVTEGNSGSINAVFTVTLSAPSTRIVKVKYATQNGSATAGSDYVAKSGTLTFAVGVTTQLISVSVLGDTTDEPNETFFMNLYNPTRATIGDDQAQCTIIDND